MGRRQALETGPWKGVRATTDPFDDDPSFLVDATNMYIPDTQGPSGCYARPGFALLNHGAPLYTSTPFRTAGAYAHTAEDGTTTNLVVMGGHLFRVNSDLTAFTDVTPTDVEIDDAITTRVRFVSLAGQLVLSDGVHAPWVASSLDTTPIVGTYIDFDGSGTTWSAQDITAYSGALVVLLNKLDSTFAQTDIAWSAPGDVTLGYQQPTYDYRWTLEQTGAAPIFAIRGTNIGLYYFRQLSIGLAVGALGPDFQTTHTDDAVSSNVGTQSPQTIVEFTDRLFFADSIGRPWMLPLGGRPVPIWQQMRAVVEAAIVSYPSVTAVTATASFEPTLNLYLVGLWSPNPTLQAPVTEWSAFDARTGTYLGRWWITSSTGFPTAVECLGSFIAANRRAVLMAFGSKAAAPATGGYAWSFNTLLGVPLVLATEGRRALTTEDGRPLTTEGQSDVWQDDGQVPALGVTTARLGYAADRVWNADRATVVTLSDAPVAVTLITPTTASTAEGTATPAASADGTYRAIVGADAQGRGLQVVASPTTAASQWSVQRVSVVAVPSSAGVEEP